METRSFSQPTIPKVYRTAVLVILMVLTLLLLNSCENTVTEEKIEYTQGVITYMEEVSPEQFKIIDEVLVANKEDSRIITDYMDGSRDTITLYEAQAISADTTNNTQHRRHYRAYYGGLIGYYLGRSAMVPPSPASYQDQSTYNRVQNTAGTGMQQTARRTTVTRPSNARRSFGSSRSTRSYGG